MPLVAKEQSARQKAETDVRTIHKGIDGLRAELDETVKERANHDRNTKKLQTELDANSKLSKANIETRSLEEKLKKTEAEAKAAADKARQGGGKVSPEEIKRAQQEIEQVRDEIEKERTQRTALEKKARELATEIDDIREAIEDDPFLNKDSFAPTAPSKTSSPMLLSLKRLTRRGRISPRLSQRNETQKRLRNFRITKTTEAEARDKFEQLKNQLEKDLAEVRRNLEAKNVIAPTPNDPPKPIPTSTNLNGAQLLLKAIPN